MLVFEDNQGYGDFVGQSVLKQILDIFKTKFKLVFVSSCHSKFIGEIFYDNAKGADHVICIEDKEEI